MRIGFDVSQTGRWKAGCGYFADTLIQHLADDEEDDYVLYPTFGDWVWDPGWPATTRNMVGKSNVERGLAHATHDEQQLFWQHPPDDLEVRLGSPDIVHANNFFCPTTLRRARLVYTLYDLSFIAHPEWTTEANRTACFNGVFEASLYADHIVAISEYTRQHFLEFFPYVPPERVSVVYPASRFEASASAQPPVAATDLRSGQFWLCVGTLEPRKNHQRLFEAYARLRSEMGDACYPLVLAGGDGWLMDGLDERLNDLGLSGRDVVRLGYVDDTALAWLYENCFAFCYLSSFEGFGLPVIEAMSLGAAVLASNATSIPEIVDSAGVMVDPHDIQQIWQAMLRLARNPAERDALRVQALLRAAQFSWRTAASQVRDIYSRVCSRPALRNNALQAEARVPA